jgi:hypothetical protein
MKNAIVGNCIGRRGDKECRASQRSEKIVHTKKGTTWVQ